MHNLRLCPSKVELGASATHDTHFLGKIISPVGVRPNTEKVTAVINMPTNVQQLRFFLLVKLFVAVPAHVCPTNFLLEQGD